MEKTNFEVRLGGCIVEASEERAAFATKIRDLYKSLTEDNHVFKPGDIVVHKDHLRLTKFDGMMIILEVLDTPIIATMDEDERPTSPYPFRELDVRAVHAVMKDDGNTINQVFAHLYEARRFRPATEEELNTPEGQLLKKFSEELISTTTFQPGDIVMTKTGCDVRHGLDLMYFIGIDENARRNVDCSGGGNSDGELYDAKVALFTKKELQIIRLPMWTLKLWDGSDARVEEECDCPSCRGERGDGNPLMSMLATGLMGRLAGK